MPPCRPGLLLAAVGRLFVALVATGFPEDAVALNLATEPPEGALKGFFLPHANLGHLAPSLRGRKAYL
jgi:hypothetical protein